MGLKILELDEKPVATLGNIARAQFDEWQQHTPTKTLKDVEGGIAYLRLGDLRDETTIDSRGEPLNLVASEADRGGDTADLRSIPDIGLLNPIRVGYDKQGWFITAGRRRHQFMRSIFDPSTIVMCTVQAGGRSDQMIASLIENVGRANLSVPALADALYRIEREIKGIERQEIARRSGFSPTYVSNLLTVRHYLTAEETAKWRANPKAIDLKSAISRLAKATEEAKLKGKPAARVDLFETSADAAAAAPEEKARRKRAHKIATMIADYGQPNHVIGLEQRVLSPTEQLELIMRGYRLATGEEEGIVLEKLASGDVVASVVSARSDASNGTPAPAPSKPAVQHHPGTSPNPIKP